MSGELKERKKRKERLNPEKPVTSDLSEEIPEIDGVVSDIASLTKEKPQPKHCRTCCDRYGGECHGGCGGCWMGDPCNCAVSLGTQPYDGHRYYGPGRDVDDQDGNYDPDDD